VAAGSSHLGLTLPISLAIVALLAIVATSYRQTIPAYPNGGGSYIVAKDNLGTLPGLVAAASLMIDYVLTVAVSVSAGVLALVTLFPQLAPYVVPIDVALVIFITVVNLRGVRESGSIFAIPTYIFIGSALLLIIVGSIKSFFIQHDPIIGNFQYAPATESLTLFLVLRSFAAGCAAMTGIEAISNGVPAFKKPEARNARITLTWMAVILGTLFRGAITLTLDNESFRRGFLAARRWYFGDIYGQDGRKPEEPQRAFSLTSEEVLRLAVMPDSLGRYHFDEMGNENLPEYLGYLVGY
jgi:amino acid transporter